MHTLDAIQKRRAVKHFDPTYQMSEEDIKKLLSITMLSPTSFNIQNWRFVVVRDKDLRAKLKEAAWNQAQVTEASLLIILCANNKSWEEDPARYWKNAPAEVRDFLVNSILGFYKDKNQMQQDEGMRSCGIAAQTLMLAAKAMGYDSCPMVGFDFEKVAQLINLPKDHSIAMFVTVGKALKEARERGGQLPLKDVVVHDHF